MAIVGPRLTGDADVTGIVRTIRSEGLLVEKTANFTILAKEAEVYRITTGTVIATAPDATNVDVQVGAQFLLVNEPEAGTLTVNFNTSGTIGTIPSGESGLLVLTGKANANGTWKLITLDQDITGITKFSETFTADIMPITDAKWSAATDGAHSITFNASGIVSADPITSVFRTSDNQQVLIKVVASTPTSITISVPVITGTTTTFAGKVIII